MRRLMVLLAIVSLVACSSGKTKGRVYTDSEGRLYTRSHTRNSTARTNDDGFIWWMMYTDSGGSQKWTQVPEPTSRVTPTSKTVVEEEDEPTEEFEESMTDSDTITESTTEAEFDSFDASSSDSGSDSGGDSGGGDAGGGDGGE